MSPDSSQITLTVDRVAADGDSTEHRGAPDGLPVRTLERFEEEVEVYRISFDRSPRKHSQFEPYPLRRKPMYSTARW
jgi:hypothetical protein